MPRVSNPPSSGLSFQARLRRLRFSLGFPVWFDFDTQQFALDATPTRDPSLTPLDEVEIDVDAGALAFTAVRGSRHTRYEVHLVHPADRLLLRGIERVSREGCHLPAVPQDHVEFEFTGGVAVSMILRHTYPDAERETLRVFREEQVVYRMIPVDVIRTPVRELSATSGSVHCLTELNSYEFDLQLPPALQQLTEDLVNLAWSDASA